EVFSEVRPLIILTQPRQHRTYQLLLSLVLGVIELAAEVRQSKPDQVRCDGVTFVVIHDAAPLAAQPHRSDVATADPELSRNAGQHGDLMKRRRGFAPSSQDPHQIDVPVGASREVVDALPGLVRSGAKLLCRDPMDNGPLYQNLQV